MTVGYIGKILDVNLSVKQVLPVPLEKGVVRDFLGGTGLGVKILYDEVGPDVDPLSPDNMKLDSFSGGRSKVLRLQQTAGLMPSQSPH